MQQPKGNSLHLSFLDGLRGLAALYVVLYHVIADGQEVLIPGNILVNFLRFGHEAVVVFIVLSGFVLALPVARSTQLALKGGRSGFFWRRARRILPAYYVSLLMLPLFYTTVELLKYFTGEGTDWARIQGMFAGGNMLSHVLMLHILSQKWAYSINPVLWSMGTEWWAYFVFALVLIPVWKRVGVFGAAGLSIVLGLLPTVFLVLGWPTIYGFPYLLGAFGMGMAGAALVNTSRFVARSVKLRTPLIIAGAAAFAVFCLISIAVPSIRLNEATRWITDLLLAVACTLFILLTAIPTLYKQPVSGASKVVTGLLESRPLVILGAFSYSLYLTHLVSWAIIGVTLNLAPVKQVFSFSVDPIPVRILVLIPLQLIFAYGFYLLFEKPFIRHAPPAPAYQKEPAAQQTQN